MHLHSRSTETPPPPLPPPPPAPTTVRPSPRPVITEDAYRQVAPAPAGNNLVGPSKPPVPAGRRGVL